MLLCLKVNIQNPERIRFKKYIYMSVSAIDTVYTVCMRIITLTLWSSGTPFSEYVGSQINNSMNMFFNDRIFGRWRSQKGRGDPRTRVRCWTYPSGWRAGVPTSQRPEQLNSSRLLANQPITSRAFGSGRVFGVKSYLSTYLPTYLAWNLFCQNCEWHWLLTSHWHSQRLAIDIYVVHVLYIQ